MSPSANVQTNVAEPVMEIGQAALLDVQESRTADERRPQRPAGSRARARVLMLLQNNPYPQDRRVRPEAAALTEAGYEVAVIAPAAPGQRWHEVVDGVRVYRYPAPPDIDGVFGFTTQYAYSMSMTFLLSLIAVIGGRFDIVHAHNPPDLFVLVAAFYKLFGARFVFDHHDLTPEMYRARFGAGSRQSVYRVLVWFEKLSCRLADHVITTNESYKAVETDRGRVTPEHVTVVRNGPNLERVRPVDPDPRLRGMGKVIIGYVGTMGFQDGIDYLLRALHHLLHDLRRTDFYCVLIGTGDAQPGLKALASELQLDEHVWFTGAIPDSDFLRYLCAADICVDPDPSNPFNDRSSMIKMSEYMALAKPIVAFDLPEHRVTAQEAACYVPGNDEAAFARALAELMDDPVRRATMGAYGRQRVDSTLAWPYSVPSLLHAYETLVEPVKVPPSERSDPGHRRVAGSRRLGRFNHWMELRGPRYVWTRLRTICRRYSLTSSRAKQRVLRCVAMLARYDCRPTFPTPGEIVSRNREFCRQIQQHGAELAVHGYHHVDFRALSADEARQELVRAATAYHQHGVEFEGFRCPYLSGTDGVYQLASRDDFHYGSNTAIWWEVLAPPDLAVGTGHGGAAAVFAKLSCLYQAHSSQTHPAVPTRRGDLIEIPVCLPDDLQLLDGLALGAQELSRAWTELLRRTYRRGELFDLLFHPESFDECAPGLEAVLREARSLRPSVWVARLCDICQWWREKAGFTVDRIEEGDQMRLVFGCSTRATVLLRGIETSEPTRSWYGPYRELERRNLRLEPGMRPFVGVDADTPADLTAFLQEQGYLVDSGPDACRCATYIDARTRTTLRSRVQLIDLIENSVAPLVRFWRWPAGARSALCITGDLDALSLTDYLARLLPVR